CRHGKTGLVPLFRQRSPGTPARLAGMPGWRRFAPDGWRRLRWPLSDSFCGRAMAALICGSLAYDTIMVFPDQFKNHILPDKVHILNVSFLVPRMRREFGGCAGNIAYNLKLLGGDPVPMATVGQDFGPY